MTEERTEEHAMKLAADIVVAYLTQKVVEPSELPQLVGRVREALLGQVRLQTLVAADVAPPASAPGARVSKKSTPTEDHAPPAVDPRQSITPDYLISLEDGKPYRSLKRHLMAKYGLSPEQYREKWGLPPDYPMVAPSYSRDRSEVAKRTGLGRSPSAQVHQLPSGPQGTKAARGRRK